MAFMKEKERDRKRGDHEEPTNCNGFSDHQDHPLAEWIYRAEGNRSLVIADLKKKIVYRLLKRIKEDGDNKASYDIMKGKLLQGIDFVHHVMSPLIGHHLVIPGDLIELQNGFAHQINQQVDHLRPGHRKTMEVDPECPFAVCLPDHCLIPCMYKGRPSHRCLPTFSVEIKTKWGSLPDPLWIRPENNIKCSVCRFCLHQYVKVEEGKWPRRSDYCPINLFSGNPKRMENALRALFKSPQNNLRLFKDGEPVYGDGITSKQKFEDCLKYFKGTVNGDDMDSQTHSLEKLIDIIIRCLLYVPEDNTDGYHYPEQMCIRGQPQGSLVKVGKGLPRACVLGRVLQTQQLDNLDIEHIHPMYERVRQHLENHPEDRRNWNLDGPFNDEKCWKLQNPSPYIKDDGTVEFAVKKVREFHVARTAKDCSIMLALQCLDQRQTAESCDTGDEASSRTFHTLSTPSTDYRFSLAVIDLDPKPWDKIPRYLKEDKEIISYHGRFSHNIHEEYSRSPSTDNLITHSNGKFSIQTTTSSEQGTNGQNNSTP